jgi:multiple sugar transport system ATP-binding protein
LRGQTRVEIAKLHRELGATTIYVTHDQVEAMTLAHRVVVLRDGRVEQVGTPLETYYRPNSQFVAQFIGTPQMNMVAGPDVAQFESALSVPVPSGGYLGLRPESLTLSPPGGAQLQARVELVEALGAETLVYVSTVRGTQLVARKNSTQNLPHVGDTVGVQIDATAAPLFDSQGRVVAPAR